MAEIISPFGLSADPGPDAQLVARLEQLLDAAKAGRIHGLIYGTIRPNGEIGTGWAGEKVSQHYYVTAATALQWRVVESWTSITEVGRP